MVELEVDLFDKERNIYVPTLARNVNLNQDTLTWFIDWLPEMYDLSGKPIYGDSHWDVPKLWKFYDNDPDSEVIIIEHDNRIQGYAAITLQGYRGLDGKECAYVAFIASAPWNRKTQVATRDGFIDTGKMLMTITIILAHVETSNAVIELEPLPAAEGFYRKLGMLPTGKRKQNLLQYRLEKGAAFNLLNQGLAHIRRRGEKND